MQIESQELEYCKQKINYKCSLSDKKMSDKKRNVIKLFKSAPVPGNRKGKTPEATVISYYKKQIDEALRQAYVEEAFNDVVIDQKLKPINQTPLDVKIDKDQFECTFIVESAPTFDLQDLSSLEVPKPYSSADAEAIVQQKLEDVRRKFSDIVSFTEEDFIQTNDSVIIDVSYFFDGVLKEELSQEGEMIDVGFSKIPEFDTNLLGMKLTETRRFVLNDKSKLLVELGDQKVEVEVTLLAGSKSVPSPLDDELAKKSGYSSIEELKGVISNFVHEQIGLELQQKVNDAVGNKLIDMHDFKVPAFLSERQAKAQLKSMGADYDSVPESVKEQFLGIAERSLKLSLILGAIQMNDPETFLSDTEVLDMLYQQARKSGQENYFDKIIRNAQDNGTIQLMFEKIRNIHVLETLAKRTILLP